MPLFIATLRALAPLFLLILLGYGLKRARVLHPAHVPVLNGLVVNVTLPALVVRALAGAPRLLLASAKLPLALLVTQGVIMALAYALGRALRWPRPRRGTLMMVGAYGNTGFLGFPITLALLKPLLPVAVLTDQMGMNIALYVSAALVGARYGAAGANNGGAAIRQFLRSPLFLSMIVGLAARLAPWPQALLSSAGIRALGSIVSQCLVYLGQGTTPLILLSIGVALRPGAARAAPLPVLLACVLKLLLCPLVMWGLCRAMNIHGDLLTLGVLLGAMPTSVMAAVLSGRQELEGDLAVGIVFVSTILSAVTVPVLLSALR